MAATLVTEARVLAGRYLDSVFLMRLAGELQKLDGVDEAAAVMGTAANKALLGEGGFAAPEVEAADADDLVVVVKARDAAAAAAALAGVDLSLAAPLTSRLLTVATVDEALERQPRSNIAAISLPGEYAAAEARRALEHGLHVFLFSSDVDLADELDLKQLAARRGLLCMGPDCGTAIVGGVGLGFANAVRRGPVGVVAAAGSGLQLVTCLLDEFGVGVSQAIGAGGRDVSDAVGAMTMMAGLSALITDPATEAILMLAKPPGAKSAARLQEAARAATKPVISCFLGTGEGPATLDEAAAAAARAVGVEPPALVRTLDPASLAAFKARLAPGQRFVRGLYAGGTLAYETQLILRQTGLAFASNAPLPGAHSLQATAASEGHTIVDLGAADFTRGRPHPMIDARVRRARLAAEAADGDVAVVALDFVLGHGAAPDPAGDLAPAIVEAQSAARRAGRELIVLASVVGTDGDPQGLQAQKTTLGEAGAIVLPTNAAVARTAALLVGGDPA